MQSDRITPDVLAFAQDLGQSKRGSAIKVACLTGSSRSARGYMITVAMEAFGTACEPDERDVDTIADAFWGEPFCSFCGAAYATDVYREDGYPDAPCCADEDACHARFLAL